MAFAGHNITMQRALDLISNAAMEKHGSVVFKCKIRTISMTAGSLFADLTAKLAHVSLVHAKVSPQNTAWMANAGTKTTS